MKFFRAEAVVLKAREHKEADRILTLFSLEHGKLRVMSYGSARPSSRKRGAVQPFCRSRFFFTRSGDLARVDQAELLEFFPQIAADVDLFGLASYFAELVDGFTVDEAPNRALYHLLVESLRILDRDSGVLARAFEIRLLSLTGFGPELACCVSCRQPVGLTGPPALSPKAGGAVCAECRKGYTDALGLSAGTLQMLRRLGEGDLRRVLTLRPNPPTRRELKQIMARTVAFHLGRMPRSLGLLEGLQRTDA
jgi:DNA repair protein RecO (recombination protein O)